MSHRIAADASPRIVPHAQSPCDYNPRLNTDLGHGSSTTAAIR